MVYQMLNQGATLSPFHRATTLKTNGNEWTVERTNFVQLLTGKKGRCIVLDKISFLLNKKILVKIHPLLEKQMLSGAVSYWEGASKIQIGEKTELKNGQGYLEVTGFRYMKHARLCR